MAGSRSSGTMRHLRDTDLGLSRSRSLTHVRWPDGLRGIELHLEESDQRRETET